MIGVRLSGHERSHEVDDHQRPERSQPQVIQPSQVDEQRSHHQQQHGRGNHSFPGQTHELIEAEARQRPANHHDQKDEGEDLAENDAELKQNHQYAPVHGEIPAHPERIERPAAEKQQGEKRAAHDHVNVFAHEKQRPLQGRVFGVPASDEFLLGFGQVERRPVRLGEQADEKQDRNDRQVNDEPLAPRELLRNNLVRSNGTRGENHAQQAQPHGNLVTDHLATCAQAAEKRILVV